MSTPIDEALEDSSRVANRNHDGVRDAVTAEEATQALAEGAQLSSATDESAHDETGNPAPRFRRFGPKRSKSAKTGELGAATESRTGFKRATASPWRPGMLRSVQSKYQSPRCPPEWTCPVQARARRLARSHRPVRADPRLHDRGAPGGRLGLKPRVSLPELPSRKSSPPPLRPNRSPQMRGQAITPDSRPTRANSCPLLSLCKTVF